MVHLIEFNNPSAFTARELIEHPDWIIKLTAEEIAEIEVALKEHLNPNTKYQEIIKRSFLLPRLSQKLSYILNVLEKGIGAVILRGLPVEKYEPREIKKFLWGISLYLGTIVSQSRGGELINDIKDQGLKIGEPNSRYINSNGAAALHNDPCDILVMLAIAEAEQGGESELASSVAVHNEMLVHYPELLEVLYETFYFKLSNWYQSTKDYCPLPVFSNFQGYFICTYARYLIEDAQKHTDAPRLTAKQKQALDRLDEIYNSPKFKLTFKLLPGDMIILNNWLMAHGRKAYTDGMKTRRHLLRLWLSPPNSPPLPPEYNIPYTNTTPGSDRFGKWLIKW